ncbi:hypothetical protein P167DRAFT_580425 [Morchella conica CCBAS932]|uniref:Uncharacterized protein n=1 Tax=Morchella conica CCBAS932 TaxID=1392247 RepID=A0A3N4KAP1_9PEZI|nr:hypothetical protein P167DRAFT_580425 [Morchella conica CCBAS932]
MPTSYKQRCPPRHLPAPSSDSYLDTYLLPTTMPTSYLIDPYLLPAGMPTSTPTSYQQ